MKHYVVVNNTNQQVAGIFTQQPNVSEGFSVFETEGRPETLLGYSAGEAWVKTDTGYAPVLTPRQKLTAVFDALPVATQAAFYVTRAAVKSALDDKKLEVAREILNATTVPSNLLSVKTALLTELDKLIAG